MELQHETLILRQGLLEKWNSPLTDEFVSPRVAVLHQYLKNGWSGTFDKGELLFTLLKCMAFKKLPLCLYMYETSDDYNKWKDKLGKSIPIDRDGYPNIFNVFYNHRTKWRKLELGTIDERINDIANITENEIRTNAELLISNSPLIKDKYRGTRRRYGDYTPDMIIGLFNSLDREILIQLAQQLAHKKYHYNFSFGYPDILVFKGSKVKFIKVNAVERDRIWDTQAFTFENLLLPLGLDITVCQVLLDEERQLPEYLRNENLETIKVLFEEAVSVGDLGTVNDILNNVNSLYSLGFEGVNAIVFLIAEYFKNNNCLVDVAEQFIQKLLVVNLSKDEFEKFFFFYFTMQLETSEHHEIRKNLLPVFLNAGIGVPLLTSVLCKYIQKNAWDGDLKYFDQPYIELLLNNGADPNMDVSDEPHEYSDITNAITTSCDLQYESANTAYSLLKILASYGGDIRPAIESWHLEGQLLRLRSKGIGFELKPNHIGLDGETDVTRELKALMNDNSSNVINTLLMLKDAGANFNIANSEGETPLHVVIDITNENDAVIKYLFDEKVSLNIEGSNHKTPLIEIFTHLNRKDKKTLDRVKDRIDLLVQQGASVCQCTDKGLTVFHTAADEAPTLLPYLRKLIDRKPENIVEAILFKGNKSLNDLDIFIIKSSDREKEEALSFAISIKADKIIDRLLSVDIDLIVASEKFRKQIQKDTPHWTYPLRILNFIAKIHHNNLEDFWKYILEIDRREQARDIACSQLRTLIGNKADLLTKKTNKVFSQYQKDIEKRSQQFLKKIKRLLSYLNEHGVYSFDFYNNGYAPSGAGDDVLMSIEQTLVEYSINAVEIKYCWLDTKLAKEASRGGYDGTGMLIEAVDSIYVYFDAKTKEGMLNTAEMIVKATKHVGLESEWNGDVDNAVMLKL